MQTKAQQLPYAKEAGWDFQNNTFLLEGGNIKYVYGSEAIKVWIYKALKTERFLHKAYSRNFESPILLLS